MSPLEYWRECIDCACDDNNIALPDEHRAELAEAVRSGHENYSMAFYSPPCGEHLTREIADLKRRLEVEKSKVGCNTCRGRGRITYYGGTFQSDSPCPTCRGEGKHLP